ncbi:MAG: alpha/beta hydrolase family protein [Actinomycetes bacterium]
MSTASPPRNFSHWNWLLARIAESTPADPCPVDGGRPDIEAWQQRAYERLSSLVPARPHVPLNVETTETVDCDTYLRHRIVYDSEPDMSVPAYLLVPKARTTGGPAVLAQHGHGPGKSQVVGLPGEAGGEASENADYGHQLALRGYVVLAPDLRGFGERSDWNPPNIYHCDYSQMHTTMLGIDMLALDLWDLARGLDLLSEHPLVDPERLGMVGLSQGGTCTLFLSALDRRICAAVVSGYFSSIRASAAIPWNMCGSQVLRGMLGTFEHVDLAALIAPRALLVESGSEDMIFPATVAAAEHAKLTNVYTALGVPENTEIEVLDGGHAWHGLRAYPFLERHLRMNVTFNEG